ncbi:hypothetical protein BDB00DRAFT_869006 [Zychaea mexicana]|uniref:uncharacterized protein n=1 Tax=Zychaea mexicana TaxID=64656 RepID=UPI0022FDFEB0|nr:uncharacterized protein BDB00DRAFT_869006 [Zychaea mexicana]KAI9496780.1 hypothetical protein BDB00DRAFT_869006 [Zychaea mexicana]
MWARPVVKSNSVAVAPAKEPKWGRYIPEPPPSLRSATLPVVPLPPRHGSVVSHQNPYYDPQSDVSFDSQTSSTSYGGGGTGPGKRLSMNYYDGPPDLPYHYYNNASITSNNNYPQLTMLPMVPLMDRIDLFNTVNPSSNATTTHPTTTTTTDNHRYSDLFSYTATSPQPPAASQLSPLMHHHQSPLSSPLFPPPHFTATSYQDKHTSWDYDHYPPPSHSMSPLSPSPLSPSPLSPITPVVPLHHHHHSSSPGANMLMPQRHPSHRYSMASDTQSSVGYSSSSNTAYHTQTPSATVISGGGGRDIYPIDHPYNTSNSNSSSKRYSPPMMPEFSMSPPPFTGATVIGSGGPVMDERRRPSVVTVDSISVQKPQQYDLHRSS